MTAEEQATRGTMAAERPRSQSNNAPILLNTFLTNNPSVEFILLQSVDYCGITRGRQVTVARASAIASENGGMDFVSPILGISLIDGPPLFDAIKPGKDVYTPDWTSLAVCPYVPHRATVQCFVNEADIGFAQCPRSHLADIVHHASSTYNKQFLVGFEIEFYVMSSSTATEPIKTPMAFYSPASIRDPNFVIVEEAVRMLERAGVKTWNFHSEGGTGLYEISTAPLPPVEAVDALLLAQETIRSVTAARGLHATMHPKPFEGKPPCGLHVHLSLSTPKNAKSKGEGNADVRQGKEDPVANSFLQGMLDSLPSLCALTMPNYDSYTRLTRGDGVLPWVSWGYENRVCVIRRIAAAHWEFRCADAMANMYLALAAILGTGLAAVERGDELTMKPRVDMPFDGGMDEELRKEHGVTQRIPSRLSEALDKLRNDENVKQALGTPIWERYLWLKGKEIDVAKQKTKAERIQAAIQNF